MVLVLHISLANSVLVHLMLNLRHVIMIAQPEITKEILSLEFSEKRSELKVVILGLEGSGKTSTLFKFMNGEFQEWQPTIGYMMEQFEFEGTSFTIYDVSGGAEGFWHYFQKVLL